MLNPDMVRVAIVLCKRAPLKGEEALAAAQTITTLERMYEKMTAPLPAVTEDEDDDKGTD